MGDFWYRGTVVFRQNDDHVFGRPEHAGKRGVRGSAAAGADPAVDGLRFLVRPHRPVAKERQEHGADRRHGPAGWRQEHHQQPVDEPVQHGEPHVPGGIANIVHFQLDAEPAHETVRGVLTQHEYGPRRAHVTGAYFNV